MSAPPLTPGLCDACRTITLGALLPTHRDTSQDECFRVNYNRQPEAGETCPLCNIIFESITRGDEIRDFVQVKMSFDDRNPGANIFQGREIREVLIRKCWGTNAYIAGSGHFRVYADEGTPAAEHIVSRRPSPSNFSEVNLDRIHRWIMDCDLTHQACRARLTGIEVEREPALPTRVIDVRTEAQDPCILMSRGRRGRYVALSHCWGRKWNITLTKKDLINFQEGIPFHLFSRTFQDAIQLTRQLGIRYIWIDSLCIIQDDPQDWRDESVKMGSVYEDAYLTLAATSAADGSQGLQGVRPPSDWVHVQCNGVDETGGRMWFTNADWTSKVDIDESPLNQRGWVFQERELSRRIVHFAASQIYWECQQRFVGEEGEQLHFHGNSLERSQLKKTISSFGYLGLRPFRRLQICGDRNPVRGAGHTPLGGFHAIWRTSVRHYCERQFTKSQDRIVALLGLAKLVEDRIGLQYIDGHWDDGSWTFVTHLLWLSKPDRQIPIDHDGKEARRCSSWSWAALEGRIDYEPTFTLRDDKAQNWALHLQAIAEETMEYGWPSIPLICSGMLLPLTFGSVQTRKYATPSSVVHLLGSEEAVGRVYLDIMNDRPPVIFFCPVGNDIYSGERGISCLVLAACDGQAVSPKVLRRIGLGSIEQMASDFDENYDVMKVLGGLERSSFRIV